MDTPLTKAQLDQVWQLAGLFFTPTEVAQIMGLPPAEFARCCRLLSVYPDLYNHYHGGRLEQEMLWRKGLRDLAQKGSSPAQAAIGGLIDLLNAKLLER